MPADMSDFQKDWEPIHVAFHPGGPRAPKASPGRTQLPLPTTLSNVPVFQLTRIQWVLAQPLAHQIAHCDGPFGPRGGRIYYPRFS